MATTVASSKLAQGMSNCSPFGANTWESGEQFGRFCGKRLSRQMLRRKSAWRTIRRSVLVMVGFMAGQLSRERATSGAPLFCRLQFALKSGRKMGKFLQDSPK
jgi:hypothetical protein